MILTRVSLGAVVLAYATIAVPTDKRATARTSPPTGCLVVESGTTTSGYYSTLSSAVASLSGSEAACIFICSGTYEENLRIDYDGNLTIYGYTTDVSSYAGNTVTIQHNESSSEAGNLDASSALNVVSDNLSLYNVDVKNLHGKGAQAVALTANGNQQGFYGVGFYGYQNTLYAKSGYKYYSNCYVEGAVDFIFGGASAWFGDFTIASNGGGAITASSRSTNDTSWYVIDSSTITAASGYNLAGEVYLGRPWRVLARVIFQNSVLTDVVNAQGWTTLAANATPSFEEYDNTGAGGSTADREYETVATAAVTKSEVWPEGWVWIDSSY